MTLMKWKPKSTDPWKDFLGWDDDFFGVSLLPVTRKSLVPFQGNWPAVDVDEDDKNITVRADLPGLKRDEIEVAVHDGILTIKGERKAEEEKKDKNFHRVERVYGSFQRSIDLGTSVDESKIDATYNKGVLSLVIPKIEGKSSRRIEVKGD